jgi:hypothetical protein
MRLLRHLGMLAIAPVDPTTSVASCEAAWKPELPSPSVPRGLRLSSMPPPNSGRHLVQARPATQVVAARVLSVAHRTSWSSAG